MRVAVVGDSLAGLTTAFLLSRRGAEVMIAAAAATGSRISGRDQAWVHVCME